MLGIAVARKQNRHRPKPMAILFILEVISM
jgi:hypothetical protein